MAAVLFALTHKANGLTDLPGATVGRIRSLAPLANDGWPERLNHESFADAIRRLAASIDGMENQ